MEILTGNLYGVDLDAQAVEIARLNLLLKAVNQRGELPRLDNIRQGNSLISGAPEELEAAFGPDRRDKHPFNWEEQFPKIMERGGFDVIVGNPPYIRIQTLPKDDAAWYSDHYRAAGGSYDIYVLFVERALELLRPGGVFGMILPNKFFTASYGEGLRKLLSEHKAVWQVVDFEDAQVFEFSTTYTCLLFLRKEPNPKVTYVPAGDWLKAQPDQPALLPDDLRETLTDGKRLGERPWILMSAPKTALKDKLEAAGSQLGEIAERIFQGLKTSADKTYILEKVGERSGQVSARSKSQERTYQLEPELLKPLVKGGQMRRYLIEEPPRVVLFPYAKGQLLSEGEIDSRCPLTWQYLLDNKKLLEKRERGRFAGEHWWQYGRTQALEVMELPKIVTPDIAASASFGYDSEGRYYFTGGGAGGYGILLKEGWSYFYVLGLLNSKLLDWYLQQVSSPFRGGYFSYEARFIRQLPIRRINFDDPTDVARHDRIVEMVEEMLRLQKEHAKAEALKEDRRHDLARHIERLDAEIDALVYELYGLTKEEIGVVEATDGSG